MNNVLKLTNCNNVRKATITVRVYSSISLNSYIKPLTAKRNLFYIRTQLAQRSKPHHFVYKESSC